VIAGETADGAVNETVSPPAILLIPVIVGAEETAAAAGWVMAEVSIAKLRESTETKEATTFAREFKIRTANPPKNSMFPRVTGITLANNISASEWNFVVEMHLKTRGFKVHFRSLRLNL
jgi:hypothetical protein